ncbi:MAG: hypothetical protein ABEH59_10885 [Halobacteriales archaeon]
MDDRLGDGRRIAQLLASELDGRTDRGLDRVAVSDAAPEVEPTADGARAFDVSVSGALVARVLVQPDQVLVNLPAGSEAVAAAIAESGLELVRPAPGEARVIVPDGAAVKRVVPVFRAALEA